MSVPIDSAWLLPSGTPPRVLVADDQDMVRYQIVRLVAHALPGATIVEAADGQAALQAFQADGADVLVSNNHMPRLGGHELVRRLRKGGATLPIISVSADPSARAAALAAGSSWFVHKNALAEELPDLLRRALGVV